MFSRLLSSPMRHSARSQLARNPMRTAVTQSKEARDETRRQKDKEKKRKLKEELKFQNMEDLPDHPLHMSIADALNTIRSINIGKPAEKTNIACNLFVRQEQGASPINETINIPFPVSKKTKPVVFTSDAGFIEELKDVVDPQHIGGRELLAKFSEGKLDASAFTHAFATSDMEKDLKSVARILGPAGLMPSKKRGTVTDSPSDVLKIVRSFQIKQKNGHVSFLVGNCTFSDYQIMKNLKAISDAIHKTIDDPSTKKKTRTGHCYISSAHSPSLVIDFKP
ncbi:mitochondrial 54S ribosomal protein uL1m [Lodderomyces beijingensis]|uniref:Ribosomal protein n=1 Tax=Lodderomyces beijingensis TaxID=1775926 RepID=A0ABP0ZTL8_9ASCO